MFNIKNYINKLKYFINDPKSGLQEDLFLFVSSLTPLINVDLLIKDNKNRTLLSWRNTEYSGEGWHIPGGIIRFKESIDDRINKVIINEIGTTLKYDSKPIAINQIIKEHNERGHFISILYQCYLNNFTPENKCLSPNEQGFLKWHDKCPDNIINVHKNIYIDYINNSNTNKINEAIPIWKID